MRTRNLLQGVATIVMLVSGFSGIQAQDSVKQEATNKQDAKASEPAKQEGATAGAPAPAPSTVIPAGGVQPSSARISTPVNVTPQASVPQTYGYDSYGGGQLGYMLQLHNSQRARYGLSPFRMNPLLNQAAQQFAEYVGRTRSFSHYADGRSPGDRIASTGYRSTSWAENLAWTGNDAGTAMNTWMNSGGHRANILSGHQEVGFGVANGVWVAVFGNSAGGYSYGVASNGYSQPTPVQPVGPERIVQGGRVVYATPVSTPIQGFGERIISERIISERVISVNSVPVNGSPTPANGTPTPANGTPTPAAATK